MWEECSVFQNRIFKKLFVPQTFVAPPTPRPGRDLSVVIYKKPIKVIPIYFTVVLITMFKTCTTWEAGREVL